ncbi:thioredoxin-interacting protein-like [Haliotis rubra]|uniref:thioredoxin-interacting protein-like n=1 Tax=Haliotis rubra TaxID=36100 RepID=UPI001EE507B8|nr:thioredoxin-interacting protein-like [Haliotis rubra]
MALFKTCAVLLDGKKEVYRKGDTVTGSLELDVRRNVTVKWVRVYLCGQTLVLWGGSTNRVKDSEKYCEYSCTVEAGQHNYTFKFTIPKKSLPSSFEGKHGAIRYWIQVEVVMTFPFFNQWWYDGITILDDINVNDSPYKAPVQCQAQKQVSKAFSCGDAGSLTLTAETDRGAYCAGEKVALKVVVKNESTRNLGKLKAQLEQKVVYTAERKTRTEHNVIRIVEGTPVMKGEDRVWKDQLPLVDFIPPSTKARSCRILAVRYFITVLVEVLLGHNIEIDLPITIGTIPYGHAPAPGATCRDYMSIDVEMNVSPRFTDMVVGVSQDGTPEDPILAQCCDDYIDIDIVCGRTSVDAYVNVNRRKHWKKVDASSATAYTKCNWGFHHVWTDEEEFSNFKYVPMCAHVVNNTFTPPLSSQ